MRTSRVLLRAARTALPALALLGILLAACPAPAKPSCSRSTVCVPSQALVEGGRTIWILSTRGHSWETPCPDVQRYTGRGWADSTMEEFLAADQPGVPTIILIHGAITNLEIAHETLWKCVRQATYGNSRPCRFVLWSWPSTHIRGNRLLPEMSRQGRQSDCQAVALAQVLARMNPAVPVCLIGYSFGCRTALATMHLAAGGVICGRAVEFPATEVRRRYRVALVGSASDKYGLLPGGVYGRALNAMESLLLFYNPKDLPLRAYPLLRLPGSRTPLGRTGLVGGASLGANRSKVRMVNVFPYVGRGHQWPNYEESGVITRYVRPFANFVW